MVPSFFSVRSTSNSSSQQRQQGIVVQKLGDSSISIFINTLSTPTSSSPSQPSSLSPPRTTLKKRKSQSVESTNFSPTPSPSKLKMNNQGQSKASCKGKGKAPAKKSDLHSPTMSDGPSEPEASRALKQT